MTRFKLTLMLGFVLGWAVGSGRAQELWRQFRRSRTETMGFGDGSGSMVQGGFDRPSDAQTARVASA